MKRKVLWGLVILAAAAGAGAFLLKGGPEVEVVEVVKGQLVQSVEEKGYVQSPGDYEIQAGQSGKVVEVLVEEGDPVKKGRPLIIMENLDLDAQIESLKAQVEQVRAEIAAGGIVLANNRTALEKAEKDLARVEELYAAGGVSRKEYDDAQLAVAAAETAVAGQEGYINRLEAQLAGLHQQLGVLNDKKNQLVVTSPINGIILDLPVETEQTALPGTLLAQVGVPDTLEVKADVLSDDMAGIKVGQKAYVTAPLLGDVTLTGTVKQIYPRAYEKTSVLGEMQRRVPVIIALDDPANLHPGYQVRVKIETLVQPDTVLLPREAARLGDDGAYEVMLVENNRVVRRQVQAGLKNQDYLEIKEGLKPGDLVIRDASATFAAGDQVKPVKRDQ